MKWRGYSGTWRIHSKHVEAEVRASVREAFEQGKGIITGGALGVDHYASDEMYRLDPSGERLKIILPTTTEPYAKRLRAWGNSEGTVEDREEVEALITLIAAMKAKRPEAVLEGAVMQPDELTQEVYFARNSLIVELADELMAFQVNKSKGTQDTVDKARAKGIPVNVTEYTI